MYKDYILNVLNEMAEYKLFHGTPKVFGDFEYHTTGKGDDALGAGFYFSEDPEIANGYTGWNEEGGNVRPARITMDKPIIVDHDGHTTQKTLTRMQIRKLIMLAPDYINDGLTNFGDPSYEGVEKVMREAINAYDHSGDDLLDQISAINNDFYHRDIELLAPAVKKVTGYDGIIQKFDDYNNYVVWNKDQIKPLHYGD